MLKYMGYNRQKDRKPRILFIVNHFYPELGAIRTEFEVARALSRRGIEILVITTFPRPYRLPRNYRYHEPKFKPAIIEYVDRLKILRVKSFKSRLDEVKQRLVELITSMWMLLLASLPLAPFYDAILIAGDIELIISHIGIILKSLWRKPLIVILHDIHPDTLIRSGIIRGKLIIKLAETLIRTFSKHVDKVVVHSHANAKLLAKRYNMSLDKIEVVELWADTREVLPASPIVKEELKKKYVGDSSKFVISFAGVINPPQGLDVAIYAAKYLKEMKENYSKRIKFLIVGDGMDKARLVELAKQLNVTDMVKFLPLQPKRKYIEILQLSDACLVTLRKNYIQPVVPSKLLEIMAAGCPAILSMPPHSDAVKIVMKYGCGIYTGNGDPQRLAEAIMELLLNPKLRGTLSLNGRRATEEYYNLDRAVNQYEEILRRTIKYTR